MRLWLTLAVILLFTEAGAPANPVIKDPIRDFVTSADIDTQIGLPHFEQLYIAKWPLVPGQKPAVLISFNGQGGRQGNYWTTYLPVPGGYMKADDADGDVTFPQNHYWLGTIRGKYGLLTMHGGGGVEVVFYRFVHGKIVVEKLGGARYFHKDDPTLGKYYTKMTAGPVRWPINGLSIYDLEKAGYPIQTAIDAARATDKNYP